MIALKSTDVEEWAIELSLTSEGTNDFTFSPTVSTVSFEVDGYRVAKESDMLLSNTPFPPSISNDADVVLTE